MNQYSKPRTHCKRGHERIPENINKIGACKICKKMMHALWKDNNQEALQKYKNKKYQESKEKHYLRTRNWILEHPEQHRISAKKYNFKAISTLSDCYVRTLCQKQYGEKVIPPEIIQLKRALLQLKREVQNDCG